MIEAVIFDMDGVLLDSEPLWWKAEIRGFAEVGIHIDEKKCLETQGIRMAEIVDMYFERSPWTGMSKQVLTESIIQHVAELIRAHGVKNDGVDSVIDFFSRKGLPLGLATSSPQVHIDAVLETLGLEGTFKILHTADKEEFGKPHPGVYLSTAKRLGVSPDRCLAIEDSLNGIIAAKAARMKCLAVPEKRMSEDPRYAIADLRLNSLGEFTAAHWDSLGGSE